MARLSQKGLQFNHRNECKIYCGSHSLAQWSAISWLQRITFKRLKYVQSNAPYHDTEWWQNTVIWQDLFHILLLDRLSQTVYKCDIILYIQINIYIYQLYTYIYIHMRLYPVWKLILASLSAASTSRAVSTKQGQERWKHMLTRIGKKPKTKTKKQTITTKKPPPRTKPKKQHISQSITISGFWENVWLVGKS